MAVKTIIKAVKQAIWLGWKVETNWADPLIFSIYYLIKPLASLLIVGFIFIIASALSGTFNPAYFTFIFVGNSFFVYAIQIMLTMSFLIHEDRAHYESLKHIYLSPSSLWWYILGRALNGVMNASISLILTLAFGTFIFQGLLRVEIPINWFGIDYLLLFGSLVLGAVCFIALGYILCGINIMASKVQFMMPEYISGIFYLFGGVIFQPEILPSWGQTMSNVLPITFFLRNIRFAILHQPTNSPQADIFYLILTTIITCILGVGVFKVAMYKARKDGLIDRKEEY